MHQFHMEPLCFDSTVLKGNLMGNKTTRVFYCLTPRSFERADSMTISKKKRSLIVYMLDGYFGNGVSMLSSAGAVGTSLPEDLFKMQTDGILPDVYFVFPDASTRIGGSQYVNSISCGRFTDYLTEEVIPHVENRYGIENPFRVVAGHSSGGYGALYLCSHRPKLFHACIASASDSYFEYSLKGSFGIAAQRITKSGSIESFLTEFFSKTSPEKCSFADFTTLMILAMGSCYSPEANMNSIHTRLPFDFDTLDLHPQTWEKWLSFDPLHWPNEILGNLKNLEFLHLDCGDQDEHFAQFGHRKFSQKLTSLNVKHSVSEFSGGHSNTRYRYFDRFSRLSSFLKERNILESLEA